MRFLGYRRELRPVFAAADVAVLSSANEGTPVSLIEGAAAGLPAVATDVGGVAEVVTEETGVLVPPDDAQAFADALLRMATDAERRALSRYGAERLIGDIDALYGELTGAERDSPLPLSLP